LTTIQLCLADKVLDEFSMDNILFLGASSGSLSEEVIGESTDSEAMSLSSPHA